MRFSGHQPHRQWRWRRGSTAELRSSTARRTVLRYLLLVSFALLLAGAAWLVITAVLARHQLQAAQRSVTGLRTAVTRADLPAARRASAQLAAETHSAHRLTTGPAWWLSAQLPWAGRPVRSIRGCAAQSDELTTTVLQPLVRLAGNLTPGSLLDSGQIRLQPLIDAAPVLHRAEAGLESGLRGLDRLPADSWLGPVDRSRAQLRASIATLAGQLRPAGQAADLLPDLLGRTGTRRYFVGLQNEAESRGVGGIPGAFAIVTASDGRIGFERFDSDTTLSKIRTGLDLGPDYQQRYRAADPTDTFSNSTISPDFSEAGRIWAAMWLQYSGERIDGALAIDPTAISYLLKVTGPATLPDGSSVTSGQVVDLTQRSLYRSHPDKAARKAYLITIARAISGRLMAAPGSTGLVRAAARAADERRIVVWSADPGVQRRLVDAGVSGTLAAGPGYLAGFSTVNATGGKLDYYLTRTMTYSRTGCGAGSVSTASFTLANEVPDGPLPAYVTLRLDAPGYRTRPGDDKVLLSYYATPGARIERVLLDGRPVVAIPTSEHGLTVLTLPVELARGSHHTVTVTATEPARAGRTEILRQPAVHPVRVSTRLPDCGSS